MHEPLALDSPALEETSTLLPEWTERSAPQPSRSAGGLLRFITCGSVDDGKSTLIGRLLYDSRQIFEDQLASLAIDSRRYGTQGDDLDFALLVDGLSAEREQGITIDVAYRYFATDRRAFIVADAPGHEQYTPNMATGASTADVAIILVDARKGLSPQTRRHAMIASMLGIRQAVLAVNKMDLLDFDQRRFEEITEKFVALTKGLGFSAVTAIPVSAKRGDNITSASPAMPWYRGPSLLEYLETADIEEEAATAPLRFLVQSVIRPNPDFRGYAGFIASGVVRPGATVTVLPGGRTAIVKDVLLADTSLSEARAGQSVTLTLHDEVDISRGGVIAGDAGAVTVSQTAQAHLFWMSGTPLKSGAPYLAKLGCRTVPAQVSEIHHRVDITDYAKVAAEHVSANDVAFVSITFDRPLAATGYRDCRELGGFILIDRLTNDTVALGLIE